jgi:hypothetical protein
MPDEEWLEKTNSKIEKFVTGGLNIGRERIYQTVREGLFDLKKFIMGLQCSWIGRAVKNAHDNWSYQIMHSKNEPLLTLCKDDINNFGTALKNILSSFLAFRNSYTTYGNNYVSIPIFNNTCFRIRNNEAGIFDQAFFHNFCRNLAMINAKN